MNDSMESMYKLITIQHDKQESLKFFILEKVLFYLYKYHYDQNKPASWLSGLITIWCAAFTGYEEIDESKMDGVQNKPQKARQDRMIALNPTASPPPPPPRPGTSISPDMKSDTLNFENEVDDDELSGYEYVSNHMKANKKPTLNRCFKRKIFSCDIHNEYHSDKNENEEQCTVDAERVYDLEGGKQLDMCQTYEKTGGRSRSKSSVCLFDMQKSKAKVSDKDAYQKLIRETMSSTHATHNYQKLIKETMESHVSCHQYHIPDLQLEQSMVHPERKNQTNGDYQKLVKDAICSVHEYKKLNNQTMEQSGYMSNVKSKHATV